MEATKIQELNVAENNLYRRWGGYIPEANGDLNNLQRDKIDAVYEKYGTAFIGKFNYYNKQRANLSAENVFTEYTGQTIYNFDADYVIPVKDNDLAAMLLEWNGEYTGSYNIIDRMTKRIEELGGLLLLWS